MDEENDVTDEDISALREWGVPVTPLLGFKGREAVLKKLEEAFASLAVLALWGEPGVGKTTLVAEFARRRNQAGLVEGLIVYSSLDRQKTLSCILGELGVFLEIPLKERGILWHHLTDTEKRKEVLSLLAEVPCLLIWDGAEALHRAECTESDQAELLAFLQELENTSAGTKALVIGQQDSDPLLSEFPGIVLKGLPASELAELAGALVAATGGSADFLQTPGMSELLLFTKGNPLALGILSQCWIRTQPGELLRLVESAAREHRSVLDTVLTVFIESLTPGARARFGMLGSCHGAPNSLVLAQLSRLPGIPAGLEDTSLEDWTTNLNIMQIVGMVRRLKGIRYVAHPYLATSMYRQLQELLGSEFQALDDLIEACYASYAELIFEQLRDNPEFDYEVLGDEEHTAVAYFHRVLPKRHYKTANLLLHLFASLWIRQGRERELEAVVQRVEQLVNLDEEDPDLWELWRSTLARRVELAIKQGDFTRERELHIRLLERFEETGNEADKAISLYHLGRIAYECGEFEEADKWYKQALNLAMQVGEEILVARTLRQMGYVARDRRSYDSAEMLFLQSLKMQKRLGDEEDQIELTFELGGIARDRRSFDDAVRWYKECGQLAWRVGEKRATAKAFYQLGNIALMRGSFDDAENYYRQSRGLYGKVNDGIGLANVYYQIGMVFQEQGQHEEALTWYPKALEIFQDANDHDGVARVLHQLGNVAFSHEDFDEAEQHYRFALELMQQGNDEHTTAHTLHQLGNVARAKQKNAEALHYYSQAAAIFERHGDVPHLSITRRAIMDLEG